jgi:hypothetical protein
VPSQASLKPGARNIRIEKLPGYGAQIIQRQYKHSTQLYDRDFQGGCERCLQPMCRVRTIFEVVSLFSFPDSVFADRIAHRQNRDTFVAMYDFQTDRLRGGGILCRAIIMTETSRTGGPSG